MNVLMTGTAGMLGSALVPAFVEAGHTVVATDIDTSPPVWGRLGPDLTYLDVRDEKAVIDAIRTASPSLVAHLAAETDLEISDADVDAAYLTNATATRHVAAACAAAGVPLVYISTAGVFDGVKDGPYDERDAPNPINTYGATKLAGEHFVEQLQPQHFIVRAGWMVGGGPGKDHKFVAKMLDQVREGRRTIHAVGDKLGTPTYTKDFANTLLGLVETTNYGRYHMACEGEGSRYDVALHILDVLGLLDEVELVEVGSEFFAADYSSNRPRSESMTNRALELLGLNRMRPWRDALEEYILANFSDLRAIRRSA